MQKNFLITLIFSCVAAQPLYGADFSNFTIPPQSATIFIKPMEEFSGLKKEEILNKRIAAVKNSPVFKNLKDYTPSSSVFQIEDNLPWISAHEITCFGISGSKDIGKGNSRESVGILNPELLFVINIPALALQEWPYPKSCSPVDYLIPQRADYNQNTNTISAYIDHAAFYRKNDMLLSISLEDANAHDLGYNYVFADQINNIAFHESTNFSTDVTQTSGFFHRGFSCKAPSGCNNYSPYQKRYSFYMSDPAKPASLHIKLWKNQPASSSDPSDMNYELILQ